MKRPSLIELLLSSTVNCRAYDLYIRQENVAMQMLSLYYN